MFHDNLSTIFTPKNKGCRGNRTHFAEIESPVQCHTAIHPKGLPLHKSRQLVPAHLCQNLQRRASPRLMDLQY